MAIQVLEASLPKTGSFRNEQYGGLMRTLKILPVLLAMGAIPLPAAPQQQSSLTQVVDKIVAQEQAEMQSLR